ncbi:MAG: ribonuclease R [Bacteroidales bacterium]|jgi:ribonuclease R|nr:ribonuclease R [Bacteroidales bacterium]
MSRKKQPEKAGIDQKKLIELITRAMAKNPRQPLNYRQLSSRLQITEKEEKKALSEALSKMKKEGLAEERGQGKYLLKAVGGYITGTIDLTKFGYAFVISDELEEDVFVAARNLNTALHGDKVKVVLYARHKGKRHEGEVVEIITRSRASFVGTIELTPNFAFLIPDNKNMPFDLFIPLTKLNGAKQGQKAVARMIEWDQRSRNPMGEITEVLGNPGENDTEMHAILAEFGLPNKFDPEVEASALKIDAEITKEDIAARRDFRDVPTFTIDPEDAKDFDDALSFNKLPNGNMEVGIHIADVTHYVRTGSLIDKVAQERATSVYLVDRTIPMLPERLSNHICSLNPLEDKLTYSAVFELDSKGNVVSEWFGRTVIRSDRRFSYSGAQQVIDTGEGDMKEQLLTLHNLAQMLRSRRFASGSFAFERLEVKFNLSETGIPLGILFREFGTANQLIEEFMLLANRRVAEYVGKKLKGKTFVYRIHDKPNSEKLSSFSYFIKRFGYQIDTENIKGLPAAMNKLMDDVSGKKEQNLIETLALRSMAKAVYSTDNIGHYGLAFSHYTHFTSPIRRYPDMMVHRLLTKYLEGQPGRDKDKYAKLCEHSSKMERLATDAERASIKYKQVEYMSDKIGKVFEGVISGVTEWGIYVEIIENQCEGMVAIRELQDDYFEYDEVNYCIRGKHSGKVYMLGDKVSVEVARADLRKRQLDYRLA